ncbi:peptidogalycan biosysnthesis protein, partial [uncultured Caballeronia sp.]|uniref:peptidogalycan biosysnthesis protein n=1 Tax=uncultured Caballeronia sp. TaxID=1827198 RepID=UPI0035CB743D
MLGETRIDIGGNPGIETSVGAFYEIQEPGHESEGGRRMPRIIPQASLINPAPTKTRDFGENNHSALHQAHGNSHEQARSEVSPLNRTVEIHVVDSLDTVSPDEWNRLAGDNPFVRHEFLSAMQDTGCAVARTGWRPHFLLLKRDGKLAG